MKKADREAFRKRREEFQQARRALQRRAEETKKEKDQAAAKALIRPNKLARTLAKLSDLERAIFERAPRLYDGNVRNPALEPLEPGYGSYTYAVCTLVRIAHTYDLNRQPLGQDPRGWVPKGKGRNSLFCSLAEHCFAKYKVPAFLWNAFFSADKLLHDLTLHVASGGSLYDFVKNEFPVPLTRKMCHDFLTMPGNETNLIDRIRLVQTRAAGADVNFYRAWKETEYGRSLHSRADETFWATAIDWFSKQKMLDTNQIGPLVDYIGNARRVTPSFSMKGRTVPALMRDMREWHRGLGREWKLTDARFTPSGRPQGRYTYTRRIDGEDTQETWTVTEILTVRELHREGRLMGHCAYSYRSSVESGHTSIWTVTMKDGLGETGSWGTMTVRVVNASRSIIEARARYNQPGSSRAQQVVARWASEAGLMLRPGVLR